jgi:hypothetical protein
MVPLILRFTCERSQAGLKPGAYTSEDKTVAALSAEFV